MNKNLLLLLSILFSSTIGFSYTCEECVNECKQFNPHLSYTECVMNYCFDICENLVTSTTTTILTTTTTLTQPKIEESNRNNRNISISLFGERYVNNPLTIVVTDTGTGKGVKDAYIEIYKWKSTGYSQILDLVKIGRTSREGMFKFSLKERGEYLIKVEKPNCFKKEFTITIKYDPCRNNIKDPFESDVDCGGPCKKCSIGKKCRYHLDCETNFCKDGICQEKKVEEEVSFYHEKQKENKSETEKLKNETTEDKGILQKILEEKPYRSFFATKTGAEIIVSLILLCLVALIIFTLLQR